MGATCFPATCVTSSVLINDGRGPDSWIILLAFTGRVHKGLIVTKGQATAKGTRDSYCAVCRSVWLRRSNGHTQKIGHGYTHAIHILHYRQRDAPLQAMASQMKKHFIFSEMRVPCALEICYTFSLTIYREKCNTQIYYMYPGTVYFLFITVFGHIFAFASTLHKDIQYTF